MASFLTHIPASLRSTPPSQLAKAGYSLETTRPYLIAGRKERSPAVGRTAFIALAKESEDARITGSTRSLDRRLLALNLRGMRQPVMGMSAARIA
jgi:hypothetical protein